MGLSQLWSFSGRTDRKTYALIGVIAFAIKSNIDRIVATYDLRRGSPGLLKKVSKSGPSGEP